MKREAQETKDRNTAKLKLLLKNQKKLEDDVKKMTDMSEELRKENQKLEKEVADKAQLEEEVLKCQQQIKDLDFVADGVNGGPMFWEKDEELKELSALELREIIGHELTPKEKAVLNEMCVAELEKDLKTKTTNETSLVWEIANLKKDLQKTTAKLSHLEQQREAAKYVLGDSADEPKQPQPEVTPAATKSAKRKSSPRKKLESLAQRITRSQSKSSNDDDLSSTKSPVYKKTRSRAPPAAAANVTSGSGPANKENPDPQASNSKKKQPAPAKAKSVSQLPNKMPENPFLRKAVDKMTEKVFKTTPHVLLFAI